MDTANMIAFLVTALCIVAVAWQIDKIHSKIERIEKKVSRLERKDHEQSK